MRGWWCALAAALLVTRAHAWPSPSQDALPAAAAAHDALLVTRVDDTTPTPPTTADPAAASTSGVATEAPPAPLEMSSMEVVSEVALRYAHTTVLTRMYNPAHSSQEATFSLILPETAFISGFVMTLDGTAYKAYVKEKEEAKAEYASAVAQGIGAAHISAKARDSNHFTVRVNMEPHSEALFNLTYEELLERRGGVYNHAINLNPGRAVPRLDVTVHIKEGRKISVLRVPDVRTGNEIDATELDAQNGLAYILKSLDEKEATVKFSPDIAEQQRLMNIYTQKTRESRGNAVRSYRYPYEPEQQDDEAVGVLGQFVVQYDVEHGTDGEIFLNDGYFVHFFSPPQLPPLRKHVVFVLDTSSSMMGRKVAQLREAMTSILSELNSGDYFNIVEFGSITHVFHMDEAKYEQPRMPSHYRFYSYGEPSRPIELVAPSPVTEENIRLAKIIVSRLYANGGTNIDEALTTAIRLVNCGVGCNVTPKASKPSTPDNGQSISSSPAPTAPTPPQTSSSAATSTTTNTVAEPSTDAVAGPEPIIIFLTDGDPTVGETDPKRIIKRISELNTGRKKAAIFSLAFGEDADRNFLRKLSLRNEGFLRHIYEAADAAQQLSHFYRQVSSPLLANVRFIYPPDQVDEGSVTKRRFHTLYKGGEVVVAGRVADLPEVQRFSPRVEGYCGVRGDEINLFAPEVRVAPAGGDGTFGPLERLWAYLTIKQKLDERDATADSGVFAVQNGTDPEREALRLALKYSFVTPLTSLVVVKPNATSAVDAESLDNTRGGGGGYAALSSVGGPAGGGASYAAFSPGPAGLPGVAGGTAYRPVALDVPAAYPIQANSLPSHYYPSHWRGHHTSGQTSSASSSRGQIAYYPSGPSSRDGTPFGSPGRVPSHSYPPGGSLPPQQAGGAAPGSAGGVYGTQPPPVQATWITTSRPATRPAHADAVDPLEAFALQEFGWARPLVDTAAARLTLQVNGSAVPLRLADAAAATSIFTGEGAACARAASAAGEAATAGVCTYLPHCAAARTITAQLYAEIYCDRDGYAGVCCPVAVAVPTTAAAPVPAATVPVVAVPVAAVPDAAVPVVAAPTTGSVGPQPSS